MIRVFIGCCADGSDAESRAVVEYTLRAHASEPLELTWLMADPSWNTTGWSTPFTGLRWAIPAPCGFKGRAIYLDSDMIVQGDIAGLWNQPIPSGAMALVKGVGRKMRTCVMVLDCAVAQAHLPPIEALKRAKDIHGAAQSWLSASPELFGQIDGLWNCIDLKGSTGIDDPDVKIIHYSSLAHQPSTIHADRRLRSQGRRHWYDGERFDHWRPEIQSLFDDLLSEAAAAGYMPEGYEPADPYSPPIKSYKGVRVKGFSA